MLTKTEILNEWKEDSKIDDVEYDQTCRNIPNLHGKYIRYYGLIASAINQLEKDLKVLRSAKSKWLNGYMPKEEMDERGWEYDPFNGQSSPLKSELKNWVDNDEEVVDLMRSIDEHKIIKEILKDILEHIRFRAPMIKTMLESRRFIHGRD